MKLTCLGKGPCRCLVIRFRKANILLDCGTPLYAALCGAAEDFSIGPDVNAPESHNSGGSKGATGSARDGAPYCGYQDGGSKSHKAELRDFTPFIPLLRTMELHAALISSAEALLALPYLLQYGNTYGRSGDAGNGKYNMDVDDNNLDQAIGGRGSHNDPPSRSFGELAPAWHHVGPIEGPVYCTQAALDAAEQLVAERLAAEVAAEAAGSRDWDGGVGGRPAVRGKEDFPTVERGEGAAQAVIGNRTGTAAAAPAVEVVQERKQDQRPAHAQAAPGPARPRADEEQAGSGGTAVPQAIGEVADTPDDHLPYRQLSYCEKLGIEVAARQEGLLRTCWHRRAPWSAVRHCLDRVRPVRYGQVVALDSYELTAVPYPSGSGFGHAVWQITDGVERCRTILYLPNAAPVHPFAPTLPLELVRGPDALILGPDILAPSPSARPPPASSLPQHPTPSLSAGRPPQQVIKELVLRTVTAGGSMLVPVYATGEAWELLEAVASFLTAADVAPVPLLYVGPRAGTSLALATVSLEALAPERQAAVYRPQHPFAFNALMQAGRLVVATSLQDPAVKRCLQSPAVVLASADSLLHCGGPALELLLRFGPDPRNILVVPHAAPPAALLAVQRLYDRHAATVAPAGPPPLRMPVIHLPLRGSGSTAGPSPGAALDLLHRLQPRHLLLSSRDLALLRRHQQYQQQHHGQLRSCQMESGVASQADGAGVAGSGASVSSLSPLARESIVPYDWLHQVRVALPRNVHDALVAPELLQRLQWLGAGPGLQLARLNCLLVFRDGAWHADPVPGSSASADSAAAGSALVAGGAVAADQLLLAAAGGPSLTGLLGALAGHGVTRVAMVTEGEVTRLTLDGADAELTLRPSGAHIHTACPVLRHVLTDCLMRQLTAL